MTEKIRVVIGSASEDLAIVDIVTASLRRIKNVEPRPWTGRGFRKPCDFFLDSLIKYVPETDQAILVFGASDTVVSRGQAQTAPRDNVIFELGLFMSQLERQRSLVIVPTTWKTNLKILSDLQGVNLEEYDPPKFLESHSRK